MSYYEKIYKIKLAYWQPAITIGASRGRQPVDISGARQPVDVSGAKQPVDISVALYEI